jgi:hypothetical protein
LAEANRQRETGLNEISLEKIDTSHAEKVHFDTLQTLQGFGGSAYDGAAMLAADKR